MEGAQKKSEIDRISALPDVLVQHVLSFLPSTKEAIRTGILSKRWKDQWTRVPALILKPTGMSEENFLKFTENVLLTYDSFKIKKFCIKYGRSFKLDPQFHSKIHFATRRNVEELTLKCSRHKRLKHTVPEFLFENASLVKLQIFRCILPPQKVNWKCLKKLSLNRCTLSNQTIKSVLSGSPLLKGLTLRFCGPFIFGQLIIISKSLKRLVLESHQDIVLEISCPKLEELSVSGRHLNWSNQVMENILSRSLLLKTLKLHKCHGFDHLVIASKTLRRLVLEEIKASLVDISCPNLKELKLQDLKDVGTLKMKDAMLSISSANDLTIDWTKGSVQWKRVCSS